MFLCVYIMLAFAVSFQWDSIVTDTWIVEQELGENSFGRCISLLAMVKKVCVEEKSLLGKINLQVSFRVTKINVEKPKWFFDVSLLFSSLSLILFGRFTEYSNRPEKTTMLVVLEMSEVDGFGKIWLYGIDWLKWPQKLLSPLWFKSIS